MFRLRQDKFKTVLAILQDASWFFSGAILVAWSPSGTR
jgi:hypothetical protein